MNVNYDRVCRLCLSSRGELLPIFPTTSSDDSEPPVLASKIKDCVSVQINENDNLPTNVCRKCLDNVNNWYIFKSVCERTQNKLQSLIGKDGSQLEEVQIKSEPLSDEAYDDGVVIDGSYPENEDASPAAKLQPEGPPILASLGLTPRSDKKYVDPRMDWHRVHAILDIVQDDEVIDSLQSNEETDVLQNSDHDSDTETELQQDIDDEYVDCKNGYICKNKQVLSKNPKVTPSMNNIRIREMHAMQLKKNFSKQHCPQPKNAWQLIFTDDLLELIVTSTNENILGNEKCDSIATSVSEIKTLIGILYLHGIMRPTHQKCIDLWNDQLGLHCVSDSMKYERFKFLLQNICFDKENNDSIIQFDIMKHMRKVFEIFAMNCRTAHEIGNIAVIDEIIVPVYGPCPFRYDINKKPLKCGIKMVMLVDSSTFYVSNLDVITDAYFGAEDITKKLVHHLAGSGKTIVMDSWYTSTSLIKHLKNEYQLFSIAALNPSNEWIPPLFLSQYRKSRTFMSGFVDDEVSITSYVNSESKATNVITNEPRYYRKGHVNHTTVVSVYKKNQSSVEVVDVLMNYYTTMQHTNDWTLSLFFTLLNIATINAQVIWSSQNTSVAQRRLFIKQLALSLLVADESKSSPKVDIMIDRRENLSLFREIVQPYYKSRRRCKICVKTTKRDRRTKQFCLKCGQPICREHTVNVCTMCASCNI